MKKLFAVITVFLTLFAAMVFIKADSAENKREDSDTEEQIAVFVKDSGSDSFDGKTAKTAFSTLNAAYASLKDTGGIIVVCGKLTLNDESSDLPRNDHAITLTSYYEGIDYRNTAKAEISYKDRINIHGPANTYIYGIKLHSEQTADIFCNGTSVRFGTRIDNTSDTGINPSIWGGCELSISSSINDGNFSNFRIEVEAGYWHHVTAGNKRSDRYAPMSCISNAALKISGGTFTANDKELYTSSAVCGAYIKDNITLDISGGMFYGSFYVIGYEGELLPHVVCKYNADISVKINNASFSGKYIKALYNKNAELYGTYSFDVSGGSFSSLTYIGCENVYSDIQLKSCDEIHNKLYGFEKVVFVSPENGDDKNSGASTNAPMKSISSAVSSLQSGGTIVLCSPLTLNDGFALTQTEQSIKITSKYYDYDFSLINGAKLILNGSITLPSDVAFDNIVIESQNSSYITCNGEKTVFGNNITTNGNINLVLGHKAEKHELVIQSGKYSSVKLNGSDTYTSLSITGGSVDQLLGFSEKHKGDILAELSGGEIRGDISIAPFGCENSIELILGDVYLSGTISTERPDNNAFCRVLITSELNFETVGFDIITDKYAFVKDKGTGDGKTPASAAPELSTALNSLGADGGYIIFCGEYTHNDIPTEGSFGRIIYTSKYGNIDFSNTNKAALILEDDFVFTSDAEIKDITVISNEKDRYFDCASNNVVFGYGIKCESLSLSTDCYPDIYADKNNCSAPTVLLISGGTWHDVYGGAHVDICGSVIYGKLFGSQKLMTDCTVNIKDGVIFGGIFMTKELPQNSSCNISLTINGGTVYGVISPSYESSDGYSGIYTLTVTGGKLGGVEEIKDASFIGSDRSYAYLDTDKAQQYQDSIIAYKNPISKELSSIHYYKGNWYLLEAFEGNCNIYRSSTIQSIDKNRIHSVMSFDGTISDISVSEINDTFYIFVTSFCDGQLTTYVCRAFSRDGSVYFENIQALPAVSGKTVLSPSLFSYESNNYLYFSLENGNGADIYCVKLKNGFEFDGEPVMVLTADQRWEKNYLSTPRVLTLSGFVYLCYTASDIYNGSSMIGISMIINRKDLLDPSSYLKDKDPAVYESKDFGNFVLKSFIIIKGHEPYIVFTTDHKDQSILVMQSFALDSEYKPYFGDPSDIDMLYQCYHEPKQLLELLSGFKLNIEKPADIQMPAPPDDDLVFGIIKKEYIIYALILLAAIILLLIIILFIRKVSASEKSTKKNYYQKDRHARRRSARRTGKIYTSYIEKKRSVEQHPKAKEESIEKEDKTYLTDESQFNERPERRRAPRTQQIKISQISDASPNVLYETQSNKEDAQEFDIARPIDTDKQIESQSPQVSGAEKSKVNGGLETEQKLRRPRPKAKKHI